MTSEPDSPDNDERPVRLRGLARRSSAVGADSIERVLPSPDDLPDPLVVVDGAGQIRFVNEIACELLAWSADDLLGTSVFSLLHPDDANLALASFESVGSKRTGELIVSRVRTGLGAWMSLELRGNQREVDGQTMTVLICRDISNRHALELAGGEVAILRSVMNNMHGMIAIVDPDGRVRSVNGAVTRLLGHDPELVAGRSFVSLVHDDDRAQVVDVVSNLGVHESVQLDARFRTTNGDYLTCEFTVNNLSTDATLGGYIVSGQVAAALSDARERVDFLADHDRRTGLLNRDGFMKGAHELLRQGGGLGLMIVDIVQFRSINELYGERIGDAVLTAVAQRIDHVRWPDLLTARFGGDEFVLAVRSASVSAIEMLRERLLREAAHPIVHDGQEINIEIRTAAAFEARPQGLDSLLASASNELMAAKRNADPESGGITFDAINERRVHLDQLRAALAGDEIQPFFQPIVDANGTVVAIEALVRWVHPLRGVLGVSEILPIAQMAGLAKAIDEQVLDMSLAFASQLTTSGYGHVEVHVNVDPKVISEPTFASSFLSRCASHATNPGQIVVELTETDLLAPGATALNNMQTLRRAGTHVSIDDFGTGYSSLSHLLELPVDGVKIDRRFVAGIDVDPAATNLTTAILGLSESLHLNCVAEGVEQPYQLERLISLGCSSFQGWLFSPAVSATEMLALLPRLDAVPAPVDAH